ncbi:uncharacterized protein LOC110037375 [Phalaenopsis equestris]|uniref:uncharacterized protein LOC110037375 n=1 Tax=Phalaenopsis equestris TaxID=78828 RepID=UPI0009E39934|nr:uncharacterized protein LOC110037375 [Phalaenopsis equestris]
MASQATRIPPSLPKPHRKPLRPKNFTANLATPEINSKKPNLAIVERAEKENLEISGFDEEMNLFVEDASLSEELEGARLRTERLRLDRERGETKIREMEAAFERWMIGAERRLHDILVAEMDIRRLVRAKEHRASCLKSSAFMSLRAREEKKRWQVAQLQEKGNAVDKRISESSGSIRNK